MYALLREDMHLLGIYVKYLAFGNKSFVVNLFFLVISTLLSQIRMYVHIKM